MEIAPSRESESIKSQLESRGSQNESKKPESDSKSIIKNLSDHLPSIQMFFVFLPLTLYSIFTQGMSPVDPELRTGYYSLFLALIPLFFSIGFFIGGLLNTLKLRRYNIQNPLMVIFNILIALSIVSCIIWFEYKFSLWPWGNQGDYIGWDWQSHYQQKLLQILFTLLAVRSGLGMSKRRFTATHLKIDVCSTIALFLFISIEYFTAWVFDSWIMIYYIAFAYAIIFPVVNLLINPGKSSEIGSQIQESRHNQPKSKKIYVIQLILVQIPILILLPFVLLAQNCFIGMIYITHYWSMDWLLFYAILFAISGSIIILILYLLNRVNINVNSSKSQYISPVLLLTFGTLLLFSTYQFLIRNLITPLDLVFTVLTALSLGLIISAFILLIKGFHHFISKYIVLIFSLLLGSLGYAGGLAYYYYEPLGLEYGNLILSWLTLIAFLVYGICLGIQLIIEKIKRK